MAIPVVTSSKQYPLLGHAFSYQIQASDLPHAYFASGLPPGLTISRTSGVISGVCSIPGTFAATVTATNTYGSGTGTITFVVSKGVPIIPFQTITVTVGVAMEYTIKIEGGFPVTSWTIPNPASFPPGLGMSSAGVISGTPTQTTSATVVVVVARNDQGSTTVQLKFVVVSAGGYGGGGPIPTTPPAVAGGTISGTVGVALSYNVGITGTFTALSSAGLPPGLGMSSAGAVTGTPTSAGQFEATITASNAAGTGTGTITFAIDPDGDEPTDNGAETSPNTVIEIDLVTGLASVVNGVPSAFYNEQRIFEVHFVPRQYATNVTNLSFTLKEAGEVQQYQVLLSDAAPASTDGGKTFVFAPTTFAGDPLRQSLTLLDGVDPSLAVVYALEFFWVWAGKRGKSSILDFVVQRPEDFDPSLAAIVDPGTSNAPDGAPHVFTEVLPALIPGRSYDLRLEFGPEGAFASLEYLAMLSASDPSLYITPNHGAQALDQCGWTLLWLPLASAPGDGYGSGLPAPIALTARLWGRSWQDADQPADAAWIGPTLINFPASSAPGSTTVDELGNPTFTT